MGDRLLAAFFLERLDQDASQRPRLDLYANDIVIPLEGERLTSHLSLAFKMGPWTPAHDEICVLGAMPNNVLQKTLVRVSAQVYNGDANRGVRDSCATPPSHVKEGH